MQRCKGAKKIIFNSLRLCTFASLRLILLLVLLAGCAYHPHSESYRDFYRHLENRPTPSQVVSESPYFLVILVEARHLDYSSTRSFFKTVAKHPSDGTKNGDVGHAWIYLQGNGIFLEGGHSGELGLYQPRYMEGVFLRYEKGDNSPISYLWETQQDGFFQEGSGNHYPTYAVKVNLTERQFYQILRLIENYPYREYAITGNQCCTFACQIAAFAGLDLECEMTIPVESHVKIAKREICLWEDPNYSQITFSSPDMLEKSLMECVSEGKAEEALSWYKQKYPKKSRWTFQDVCRFPERYLRFKSL